MGRIAADVVAHGEVADLDDVLDRYRRTTRSDIDCVLARLDTSGGRSLAVVGPLRRSRVQAMAADLPSTATSAASEPGGSAQPAGVVPT